MSVKTVHIYHNPRCSKSRSALTLLEEKGVTAEVIEYLKTPLTKTELREILKKLGMKPEEIVRKSEEAYKTHFQGAQLSDEAWLDALIAHPTLIERPIVVAGDKAVIGRPPEQVLALF
jgi:arsenate reductase (glutaredoxin)